MCDGHMVTRCLRASDFLPESVRSEQRRDDARAPAVLEFPLNLNFRGELQRNEGQRPHFRTVWEKVRRNFIPTLINCFLESKEIGYDGGLLYLVNKAMINSIPIAPSSPLIPINHIC